jgi:hypothetical protein
LNKANKIIISSLNQLMNDPRFKLNCPDNTVIIERDKDNKLTQKSIENIINWLEKENEKKNNQDIELLGISAIGAAFYSFSYYIVDLVKLAYKTKDTKNYDINAKVEIVKTLYNNKLSKTKEIIIETIKENKLNPYNGTYDIDQAAKIVVNLPSMDIILKEWKEQGGILVDLGSRMCGYVNSDINNLVNKIKELENLSIILFKKEQFDFPITRDEFGYLSFETCKNLALDILNYGLNKTNLNEMINTISKEKFNRKENTTMFISLKYIYEHFNPFYYKIKFVKL